MANIESTGYKNVSQQLFQIVVFDC